MHIFLIELGNITETNPLPLNAFSLISVTLEGILMDVSPEQDLKAEVPIYVTELGMLNS